MKAVQPKENVRKNKDPSPPDILQSIPLFEPFQEFTKRFVGGTYPLFAAALAALIWANVDPQGYHEVWHAEFSLTLGRFSVTKSLVHWIDEALMTLFFFTVGLEIKREILVGELASLKQAMLPIAAAVGGMALPAAIYILLNAGTEGARGWGIPMATDIAFSLAVLAALGSRIPLGLRVFLSAFAIADDLGAVLVIALFYTREIDWNLLLTAGFFMAALALANILWIRHTLVYILLGIGLWFGVLGSGVHATVAGVLVAMFIPAKGRYDTDTFVQKVKVYLSRFECEPGSCGYTILLNHEHLNNIRAIEEATHDVETPLQRMEYALSPWISLFVLPLFALANSGLVLKGLGASHVFSHPITMGIILGLCLGKPIGISLFTYLVFKLFKAGLPTGVTWSQIIGVSILGGIGFTMSLFISGLSFESPAFMDASKLGIFIASVISGLAGLLFLKRTVSTGKPSPTESP
jgi:NhaA family Na+:H+ antiporter